MRRTITAHAAALALLGTLLWPAAGGAAAAQLPADLQSLSQAGVSEGLQPLQLPADYGTLPPAQQMFVLLNLERQLRGLPLAVGLAAPLDSSAAAGAAAGGDPQLDPAYAPAASVWGEAPSMPQVVYGWLYDDGWNGSAANTPNLDCTSPTAPGCNGHRRAILGSYGSSPLMGASVVQLQNGAVSAAAILASQPAGGSQPALDVTWSQVGGGTATSTPPAGGTTNPGGSTPPTPAPMPVPGTGAGLPDGNPPANGTPGTGLPGGGLPGLLPPGGGSSGGWFPWGGIPGGGSTGGGYRHHWTQPSGGSGGSGSSLPGSFNDLLRQIAGAS